MNSKENKLLYKKLRTKKIDFQHVCEVGVYLPETSNIIDFIKDGKRATLVEADPDTVRKIQEYFKEYSISVVPKAIWHTKGTIKLSKAAASTFITQLPSSPALINDQYKIDDQNTFEVECCQFGDIDDGSIDLISIDIEGGEWYVIKYIKSRPAVISIETHGKYYTNPFLSDILSWMSENGYQVWYKDKSDTIFVLSDKIKVTFADRLSAGFYNVYLSLRKAKGYLLGRIK